MTRVFAALVLVTAVAVVLVISNRGVTITVKNVDSQALNAVIVHVTGKSYAIGDIQPGEERSMRVSPAGESRLEIEHSKGRLTIDTYFENGYRGEIAVDLSTTEIYRVDDNVRVGII